MGTEKVLLPFEVLQKNGKLTREKSLMSLAKTSGTTQSKFEMFSEKETPKKFIIASILF